MITSLLLAYLAALALCLTSGFRGLFSQRPPLRPQASSSSTCAPGSLQARLTEISRMADGKVGAALMLVETGDMLATLDADDQFPMERW